MQIKLDDDEVRDVLAKALWEKICAMGCAPSEQEIRGNCQFEVIDPSGNAAEYESVSFVVSF